MYVVGVDLGQAQDPTALCILQREAKRTDKRDGLNREFWEDHYFVQHLERPELKTAYPEIVRLIERTVRHPKLAGQCELVVDATGVGRPVVDMMREHDLSPIPVTITGGQALTMGTDAFGMCRNGCSCHRWRSFCSPVGCTFRSAYPFRPRSRARCSISRLRSPPQPTTATANGATVNTMTSFSPSRWPCGGPNAPPRGWRGGRDELAERRRLRHIEKQETPWWRQRTASDRGPNARWRR